MKKLVRIIILMVIGSITVISCKKEEVDTDIPNQRVIFTSTEQVRIFGNVTFGDASPGVVSRNWGFPEGISNISNSSEEVIKATFKTVGEHDILLNQTFEENAFVGEELRGTQLDTLIRITVLDSIKVRLRGNYLNNDGSLGAALTIGDNASNVVEAGQSVRYTLDTQGEPSGITWTVDGGDQETVMGQATELDVKYRLLGDYGITINASTPRPFSEDEIAFTDLISVIPSTNPVTLDQVIVNLDGTIALSFSRAIEASSVISGDFLVGIENNGMQIPVSIQQAAVDPASPNVVIIQLNGDSVFFDDILSISYTQGTLISTDGVQPDSFVNLARTVYEEAPDLLSAGGIDGTFESDVDASSWPDAFFGGIFALYNTSISSVQARSGSQSFLIEYEPNGGMSIVNSVGTINVENGKSYELTSWVYVENLGNSDPSQFLPETRYYTSAPAFSELGPSPFFDAAYPTGKWVRNSFVFTSQVDGEQTFLIRGFNEFNPESLIFYLDDLSLREVAIRP